MRFIRLYLRKLKSNIQYHSIITAGLGLALTVALFIFIYVSHEFSYNKHTSKSKNIYRVLEYVKKDGFYKPETLDPIGKLLKEKSPFVVDETRYLSQLMEFEVNGEILSDDVIITDPSFFSMFEIPLETGSTEKFRNTPTGVFISGSFAKKYFGNENPEGKIIRFSKEPMQKKEDLMIVGVMKDLPKTSTLKGEIVINMAVEDSKKQYSDWNYNNENYVLIADNKNVKRVEESISAILKPLLDADGIGDWLDEYEFSLQRFDKIYLHSDKVKDRTLKGNFGLLQILIILGLLILGMSVFNYLTIHSGLLMKRLNNIQTMKCFGASQKNLRWDIIGENVLSISICAVLAIVLFFAVSPVIQNFLNIDTSVLPFSRLILFVLFLLLIAVVSGIFQYSFIKKIARNQIKTFDFTLKKVLTVAQLTVFILIISSMFVISKQVSFMRNTDLGFDLDNTVSVMIAGEGQKDLLMNTFSNKSYVKSASFGQGIYGQKPGFNELKIGDGDLKIQSIVRLADRNYLNTFKIQLIEGRNINTEFLSGNDAERSKSITEVLVNEEFVKKAGLEKPIGTIISDNQMIGEIVGVVKNVYQSAFFEPVEPMVLGNVPYHRTYLILNLADGSFTDFYADLKTYSNNIGLGAYTDLLYTKADKNQIFAKEIMLTRLFSVSFIIALIILGLGLIAMNMLIAESKTKEIGIRKVNGAKISEILALLNKDFIKLDCNCIYNCHTSCILCHVQMA